MTPKLIKIRDTKAQRHYDIRAKVFEVNEFDRETIAVESHKLGFDACYEQLAPLIEALRFYADKENWESKDINRNTKNKVFDICLFDFDRDLEIKKDYAGQRAREALKNIEGE